MPLQARETTGKTVHEHSGSAIFGELNIHDPDFRDIRCSNRAAQRFGKQLMAQAKSQKW